MMIPDTYKHCCNCIYLRLYGNNYEDYFCLVIKNFLINIGYCPEGNW